MRKIFIIHMRGVNMNNDVTRIDGNDVVELTDLPIETEVPAA